MSDTATRRRGGRAAAVWRAARGAEVAPLPEPTSPPPAPTPAPPQDLLDDAPAPVRRPSVRRDPLPPGGRPPVPPARTGPARVAPTALDSPGRLPKQHVLRLVAVLSVLAVTTGALALATWQVTAETRLELTRATTPATPAAGRSLVADLTRELEREPQPPAPRATTAGRSTTLQRSAPSTADDPRAGRGPGAEPDPTPVLRGAVLAPVSASLVLVLGLLVARTVLRRFGAPTTADADDDPPSGPEQASGQEDDDALDVAVDDLADDAGDAGADDDDGGDGGGDGNDGGDATDDGDARDGTGGAAAQGAAPGGDDVATDDDGALHLVGSDAAGRRRHDAALGVDAGVVRSTSLDLDAGDRAGPRTATAYADDRHRLPSSASRHQEPVSIGLVPTEAAARERIFERRRAPRVDYVAPGQVDWQDRTWSITTFDLSEQGLGCRVEPAADGAAPPGQREHVRVRVALADGVAELSAQVAWRSTGADGTTLGLLFRMLTEAEAEQVRRTCSAAALTP